MASFKINSLSGQMRLMGECRGSIDAVKRAEEELTDGDVSGLSNPTTVDAQGKGQRRAHEHGTHITPVL